MNLAFVRYPYPTHGPNHGIAKGYIQSAMFLRDALQKALGRDFHEDFPTAPSHARLRLHYCPPHYFNPKPGKVDVLFTMWEGLNVPEEFIPRLKAADMVVVPSQFVARVFRSVGIEAMVAPLGVHDAYVQANSDRSIIVHGGRKIRILWVGSTSPRKGFDVLQPMWNLVGKSLPKPIPAEFYMKTIAPQYPVVRRFLDGTIVDGRDLEPAEMLALYQTADVYLSTSFAEGFGLTGLEAMAAGALAISTAASGDADYLAPQSYARVVLDTNKVLKYGNVPYNQPCASPAAYARVVAAAILGWGTPAIENARRIGTMIAKGYTWENSARQLLAAIAAKVGKTTSEMWPNVA